MVTQNFGLRVFSSNTYLGRQNYQIMRIKLKIILILLVNVLASHANAGGFFETGTATLTNTIDSGFWATINYTKSYVNPVVVAGPISHNNDLTLVPRVRNVTATSFQIGMQSPCENVGSIDPPAGPCPPAGGGLLKRCITG